VARRPTIVDVARKAGVAVSTASSALNGKGRVAAATRERVAKAAKALDYRPDAGARGLVTGRAMAIGVRVGAGPGIPQASFFVELLNGAAERAADHGYALTITTSELRHPGLVDALIAVDPLGLPEVQNALDAEIPVVTVGRVPTATLDLPSVDTDHGRSIPALLDHLALSAGEGPAWLLSHKPRPSFVRDIEAAFRGWCRERGVKCRVLPIADDAAGVERVVARELAGGGTPAIVVSVLDRAAAWAQQALLAAGVGIPSETVVAAASDGEVLRLAQPAITSLDLDGAAHGRAAVDIAIELIDGAVAPTVLLPARLVIRASSGAAASAWD
jgi:DNA-binding LacI/PurR family transcriptional regulator